MFYGAPTAVTVSHENMFKHIGKVAPYDVIVLSLSHWHTQINLIVKFYEGLFHYEKRDDGNFSSGILNSD